MNKMLISDYDQTFYLNDMDIEKNKQAVSKFMNQRNIFAIATGRSYLDFKTKLNIYKFPYDYVIINHGATILDKEDNIICNFTIDDSVIFQMKEHLELENCQSYFCCSVLESRVDFSHGNLTKINVTYTTKEKAMKINYIINEKYSSYVNCYYVSNNAVEIISNQTNKSYAITLLAHQINMEKQNIYTIGDSYSDIEMIKNFNGYCMTHSIDELKSITKSYDSVSLLIDDILSQKD